MSLSLTVDYVEDQGPNDPWVVHWIGSTSVTTAPVTFSVVGQVDGQTVVTFVSAQQINPDAAGNVPLPPTQVPHKTPADLVLGGMEQQQNQQTAQSQRTLTIDHGPPPTINQ